MKLISLRDTNEHIVYDLQIPESCLSDERHTQLRMFKNCVITGRNIHYPNCLLDIQNTLVNPYDERVMSLQRDSFYDNDEWYGYTSLSPSSVEIRPSFFFIYNVDNYYHFIYDTLPYLAFYFRLKEHYPNLRIIINTSYPSKSSLPQFVYDILTHLGVIDHLDLIKPNQMYTQLFVGTSLTHGGKSNMPPSRMAYEIWNHFYTYSLPYSIHSKQRPKRFYISRRSWIHGQTANMGTNYTTRRKCENENQVVELLAKYNIQEIFTELLTMEEKIAYFQSAELVVGVIGGGMCNLLFSPPTTNSVCIVTPYFLDINARFAHSMSHTKLVYSYCTSHSSYSGKYPLYSRVKIINPSSSYNNCVGEVDAINTETKQIQLNISSNDVAGFSQDFRLHSIWIDESSVEPLDLGLNSPYICNLEQLEVDIKRTLEII